MPWFSQLVREIVTPNNHRGRIACYAAISSTSRSILSFSSASAIFKS